MAGATGPELWGLVSGVYRMPCHEFINVPNRFFRPLDVRVCVGLLCRAVGLATTLMALVVSGFWGQCGNRVFLSSWLEDRTEGAVPELAFSYF
jgi:hypothetical protein